MKCPEGHAPKSSSYIWQSDSIRVSFPRCCCENCPHQQECNAKIKTRTALVILSLGALAHTEEALAKQLGDAAKQFMRVGKRFIINMNFIYQVDVLKQNLLLSDCEHFLFQMPVSKEALKTVKELVIKSKI